MDKRPDVGFGAEAGEEGFYKRGCPRGPRGPLIRGVIVAIQFFSIL